MKTLSNLTKTMAIAGLLWVVMANTGCSKPEYHKLSDEDMAWLIYKNNQTIRYSNTANANTSFNVTLRTKAYERSGDKYNEFTAAYFQQLNDTSAIFPDDSKGGLHIAKQDDDNLLVTFSWPHFPLKQFPLTSLLPGTVTVDNINYTDVYVLDATDLTDARFYISKVYYSKMYGVIQYEEDNGEVWTINF